MKHLEEPPHRRQPDASPESGIGEPTQELRGRTNLVGRKVGRIQIVEALARGGMGEVYVGYDEKLGRKVAIKALAAEHRLDETSKARFLREARLLSQLPHPNICQIYDYIEGEDLDILVLELIDGHSLHRSIQQGLAEPDKLRIAQEIASALAVAHGQGVIHRDLKPGNVMITTDSEVKVLDFGLARRSSGDEIPPFQAGDESSTWSDSPEDQEPERTQVGAVVGTPGYMSPEQAKGEVVTTASDVYVLGLLLQELFTGQPAIPREVPRIARVVGAMGGKSRPVVGLDPDLTSLINRMKAVQPGVRPTARDVEAQLGSIREKPRRRLRRRVLASAFALLVLVVVLLSYQAVRIQREATRANLEALTAQRVSLLLEEIFQSTDPFGDAGRELTARELLDRGANRVREDSAIPDEIRVRLLSTIGSVYRSLGFYEEAEPLLRGALAEAESRLGPESLGLGKIHYELGELLRPLGRFEESERHHRESLEIRERLLSPEHPEVIASLQGLAYVQMLSGKLQSSRSYLERALEIQVGVDVTPSSIQAEILDGLGTLLLHFDPNATAEDRQRGLELSRRALAIRRELHGPLHPEVAMSMNNISTWLRKEGRMEEAEELIRSALEIKQKTLGSDHPSTAITAGNLATLLLETERAEEALELARGALEVWSRNFGAGHWRVGQAENILGACLFETGAIEEARPLLRRGYSNLLSTRGEDDFATGEARERLARYLPGVEDLAETSNDSN